MARPANPKTDRQQIIEWLEDDIRRYEGMIGEITEYKTVVTREFIQEVQDRVTQLKQQERIYNDTKRRLPQES